MFCFMENNHEAISEYWLGSEGAASSEAGSWRALMGVQAREILAFIHLESK